jgi:outer membrane protein TolC
VFAFLIALFLTAGILTGDTSLLFADETSLPSKARVEISMDQAIALMKKKHPDIRLQEVAVRKAAEEVDLATRAFLPDLDVDYIVSSASGGWGLILTAAKLLKPVFSFRKLMTEKEVKKILKQKEEVLVRYRELEVEQGVKELYVTLLIGRELSSILAENADRSQERFELVKIHHQEGGLNDEEFLRERLASEATRSEAGKAKSWFRRSKFAFERLLGLPHGEPFSLALAPFSESGDFPLNLEQCLRVAYAKNPIVKALLLEEKASLKRLGIKDPMFRSDGAVLGFGESAGGIFSGKPRFGLTGNVTLYDWGKARLKKRILGLENAELVLKHEKEFQAFEGAVVKSYFELQRLQNEISTSRAKSELFSESKRRREILGEMGRVRQADLLSLENEYTLQKTEDLQIRLEYFLVRERLVKDLGLFSLDELREVTTQ